MSHKLEVSEAANNLVEFCGAHVRSPLEGRPQRTLFIGGCFEMSPLGEHGINYKLLLDQDPVFYLDSNLELVAI